MAIGNITRISELSYIISRATGKYDDYLSAQGLPTPSFAPGYLHTSPLPSDVAGARQLILEATDELHALITGPVGTLFTPYVSLTLASVSFLSGPALGKLLFDEANITGKFPSTNTSSAYTSSTGSRLQKVSTSKLHTMTLLVRAGSANPTLAVW